MLRNGLIRLAIVVIGIAIMFLVAGCGEVENTTYDQTTTTAVEEFSEEVSEAVVDDEGFIGPTQQSSSEVEESVKDTTESNTSGSVNLGNVPKYSGKAYYVLNNNNPNFSKSEITTKSFESYSSLDSLGRCGECIASVGKDIMPTEERGSIGMVKPTGWHTVKYDCVSGKYLYNRCHLIGHQLTGENANERNLITGTRYLNIDGMLPFENMIADYVQETGNHVMYRVTPYYKGSNLLASGVHMEAYSVEDKGAGVSFNVYCYNVQPGVDINYKDGSSSYNGKSGENTTSSKNTYKSSGNSNQVAVEPKDGTMVWKSATGSKYHSEDDCGNMNPDNAIKLSKEDAKEAGLEACKICY